ncbi:ogr/Delta-like zinc finger family protein [Rouxiella badensis]|uniref:ogr/Delta-like zinc finger family protein n=1 Tax=Rouxiella badensis TaxID=1646377 RepID=UPI001D15873D|nr:ogr/Delta-like zinc finger family protein [Rouxiella badensis]MCC3742073.1 ogr/Delta-like zinc finger family protein [Rouxiella badensis]
MLRCPLCRSASHTRTSRYISEQTKESYYQCQNIECSCSFKSVESVDKIISQPMPKQEDKPMAVPAAVMKRTTLGRYGSGFQL